MPDDPLGVRAVAAERIRARAVFHDLERVSLRAFALVARAQAETGAEPDPAGLRGLVDRAIDQLLEEESRAARAARPDGPDGPAEDTVPGAFVRFARPLGLDPQAMRRACARFHALDPEVRRAFFLLVVEGLPAEEAPAERVGDRALAMRRARHALDVLRGPDQPSRPVPRP